jgi:thiol-disulfide isomerase/thioredoxin
MLSRRSVIAASAGLAASVVRGNYAMAQISPADLPPAAAVLLQTAPVAAPVLNFTDPAGKQLSLADYVGHGLVVNFWATWCGPCVAELPSFAAVASELAKHKILVLPISIDMTGANAVQPFFASHGIHNLPVLLDEQGEALQTLNADGIPVTIIVNPQGQVVAKLEGAADWNNAATINLIRKLAGAAKVVAPEKPGVTPV